MSATPDLFTPDPVRRGPTDDAARADFLAAHPPEAFLAEVAGRRARRWATRLPPLAVGLATAGLALAVVTFGADGETPGFRPKGNAGDPVPASAGAEASLGFVLKRGQEVRPGTPGQVCHAGDRLRLIASQTGYSWGLAFSVDAGGRIEPLHVGPDGRSLPLPAGVELALPGGRELDDYVGPEWYWLVVSEEPLALDGLATDVRRAVLDHVARGGRPADLRLVVEGGARAHGFWIDKR